MKTTTLRFNLALPLVGFAMTVALGSAQAVPTADISVYGDGFSPSAFAVEQPPGQAVTVTFQSAGEDPPAYFCAFLDDEETPMALFGGSENCYAVPTDRAGPLVLPKGTEPGTYVISPSPIVEKGTKGTITVVGGS